MGVQTDYQGEVSIDIPMEVNVEMSTKPRGRWLLLTVVFAALWLASAIGPDAQDRYQGEGRVIGVDESKRMLFLAHGPIPGFMPRPMRHGFEVHRVELLRGLKKGDTVRFVLEVQNEILGISSIEQVQETE